MSSNTRTQEQRILVVMRKLLAQIVKETTPDPGMRHPLSENTIEDIRQCFALIAARERELAQEAGIQLNERPVFGGESPHTKTVPIHKIGKKGPSDSDD